MTFGDLFRTAGVTPDRIEGEARVVRASLDSRRCNGETLFVARTGAAVDGEAFLDNPAPACLVHSAEGFARARALGKAAALIPMEGRPDAEWRLMDALYDHPTRNMMVIGVTGTNGKTSVCWFLRDMLAAIGRRSAYLGTLGLRYPGVDREIANTTPFAVELYDMLAELRSAGVEALAMEVSSHALAERRCDGVEFDCAVFTNLTQDHLDLHGSMEAYAEAKKRLFGGLPAVGAKRMRYAINVGDPTGYSWASELCEGDGFAVQPDRTEGTVLTYEPGSLDIGLSRISGRLGRKTRHGAFVRESEFAVAVGGSYNAENVLAAFAALDCLDREPFEAGFLGATGSVADAVRPVPGRFEPVPNERDLDVLVDYAHTPDAVTKLLDAVRPLARGRVTVVVGCGGDRDKTKRPLMARAAIAGSDLAIFTADNPRTEDPDAILDDMTRDLEPGKWTRIPDRREAIRYAIAKAVPGDAVIIAGKGHEDYQIVGRTKTPFDDRVVAREALA